MHKPFPPMYLTKGGGLNFTRERICNNCKKPYEVNCQSKYCPECRKFCRKAQQAGYHKRYMEKRREKARLYKESGNNLPCERSLEKS